MKEGIRQYAGLVRQGHPGDRCMNGVKISLLWKLHKQLKRAIIDPSLNSSKQMTPLEAISSANHGTLAADQLTLNPNEGTFPRKPVNEVLGRLRRGARAAFQTLLDVKFLYGRGPQVLQVLVTDWAFREVAQLRTGLLPPRGRRNGQPLLSDNDTLQRRCPLHVRRNGGVHLLKARYADSVGCHGVRCWDGNGRVMHDVGRVQ